MGFETAQFRKESGATPEEIAFRERMEKERPAELVDMWLNKQNWVDAAKQNVARLESRGENAKAAVDTLGKQSSESLAILDAMRKRLPEIQTAIETRKVSIRKNYKGNAEALDLELSRLENLQEKLGI